MPTPPNFKANPLTPDYLWNEKAAQYVNKQTGRFVSRQVLRDQLDQVMEASGEAMGRLSGQLQRGSITLAQWQTGMMQQIKTTHLAAGAMQRGGWQQMTQSDYGRVGRIVREQYGFLRNFARDIANGTQLLDGTLGSRAELYAEAGRGSYYNFWNSKMVVRGFDLIRSILNPGAKHCTLCLSEAAKGFQKFGNMVPIGARICLSRDQCSVEYKNSKTGETSRA